MAKRRQKPEPGSEGYPEYETASFKQMQDLAVGLISDYRERDMLIDDMEQYWSMIWKQPIPKDNEQTAVTYDTDPTNRLIGAHRLLTATAPEFSVPSDRNSRQGVSIASPLEKAAKMMWEASGKQRGMPIEKDAVLAALICGGVDFGLTNLLDTDLPEEQDEDSVSYWRMKAAQSRSPIYFEPWYPRFGYPLRGKFGLQAYVRAYDTTVAKFREEWADVDTLEFLLNKKPNDVIRVRDGVNENFRYAWLDGDKRPFYAAMNKKGIVPVVSQITEGSLLFSRPEYQGRPFLYTAHKSNLPMRKSIALTAIFTIIKSIALSAAWKHMKPPNQPGKELVVRLVGPLSVFEMEQGEDIIPMMSKGVIDPSILTALEIANQQIAESTIYSQALGEPLGGNAPFSMVALLHQAGRLPLTAPKILTGWAIGNAMELAFLWLKATGKVLNLSSMGQVVTIKPDEIPFDLQFEAKLEIDLPQDMREMAGVLPAFKGQVSDRFIRENLMKGVGQSEAMQEEIWGEQAANFFFERMLAMFAMAQEQQGQGEGGGETGETPPSAPPRALPERGGGRADDALGPNRQPLPRAKSFEPYGKQMPPAEG